MKKAFILVLCLMGVLSPADVQGQDPVVLQLRWDHQFQFAGYYAALWQGYYEEEGLDVDIRAALTADRDILSAVEEVRAGRADFGIGAADILLANDQDVPLSVAAVIFQQSASAFYLKSETPFASPADLTRLRVARIENDLVDVELQAMLLNEGISPERVPAFPHQSGYAHLLSDEVQVMPGYRTSTPFHRDDQGNPFREIRPADYGVDFYGDSLFTTYGLTQSDPELVEKFTRASLKGWQYALDNSEEVAVEITERLERVDKLEDPLAFNLFQADAVHELMLYPIVRIGNINPSRWETMHGFMRQIGQVQHDLDLGRFVFDPARIAADRNASMRRTIAWGLGISSGFLLVTLAWSYTLRAQVAQKTALIRTEEERFRALATNAPSTIFATDGDLRVTYINRTVDGSDPAGVIGRHVSDLTPTDQVEAVLARVETVRKTHQPVDYEVVSKPEFGDLWLDVRVGPLMLDGVVEGFIFILTDTSERRRAEVELHAYSETLADMVSERTRALEEAHERLVRQERLAALGELAGGVAHELRNPLGVVTNSIYYLRMVLADPAAQVGEYLELIDEEIRSISKIVSDLLDFARIEVADRSAVEVPGLVAAALTRQPPPDSVTLVSDIAQGLPRVFVDPQQVEQALGNLVMNAYQAMPEGGRLTVAAELCPAGGRTSYGGAPDTEDQLRITLADTGVGISPENLERIFEPLFTTKAKGIGLGLALSRRLVEANGGKVSVESTLGKGSVFALSFPIDMSEDAG